MSREKLNLEDYFISTNFYDLLPLSIQISEDLGFNQEEVIVAVCKVFDKHRMFPPTINRTAWFCTVFKEKLLEARADLLYISKRQS